MPNLSTVDVLLLIATVFNLGFSIYALVNARKAYSQAVKEQLAKRNRRV